MLFLSEFPTSIQVIGIIMIMAAGFALSINKKIGYSKYILFALGTSFLWGINMVLLRFTLREVSPYSLIVRWMFFMFVFVLLIRLAIPRKKAFAQDLKNISLCSIFIVASVFLFIIALSHPDALAAIANPLRRTSTIFSVIIGGTLLKEKNILRKGIGCALMLVGVVMIALG